jgi:hypothetical protein
LPQGCCSSKQFSQSVCYCNRRECSEAVISVDEYHFLSGATPYKNLHVIPAIHPQLIYNEIPAVLISKPNIRHKLHRINVTEVLIAVAILGYNGVESTSVSEEHIASIFRVEEYSKQKASVKQFAR